MGNLFNCTDGNKNPKLNVTTLGEVSVKASNVGTKTISWSVKKQKDYKKFTTDNFFPHLTYFKQFHGGNFPAGYDIFTTGNKRYDAYNGIFYYDVTVSETYYAMEMTFNCNLVQ